MPSFVLLNQNTILCSIIVTDAPLDSDSDLDSEQSEFHPKSTIFTKVFSLFE